MALCQKVPQAIQPESVDHGGIVGREPRLDVDDEAFDGTPRSVNSQVELYFGHQLRDIKKERGSKGFQSNNMRPEEPRSSG